MNKPVLEIRGLHHSYHQAAGSLAVLRGVNLTMHQGEIVALVGPSGSGKSTLLHLAGLLEASQQGDLFISGQDAARQSDSWRTRMRREYIGFVYQFHHLLPEFSAQENVMLPAIIANKSKKSAALRASELLEKVGLQHRLHHRPAELSGGEQQRVAIARALINAPILLLADEPTGNLDEETGNHIFDLLINLAATERMSALIATHNRDLARRMHRVVEMKAGQLQ